MAYFLEEVDFSRIKPGLPLRIEVSSTAGFSGGNFKSSVEDVKNGIVEAAMPSLKGRLVPFPVGLTARLSAVDKMSLYVFYGIVVENREEDGIPVTLFKVQGKIRRVQRRRFLRIKFVSNGILEIPETGEKSPFMSLDVSAGGMKIATKAHLDLGMIVRTNFEFEEGLVLKNQEAKVVRNIEGDENEKGIYLYGIAFFNVPLSMQDRIMRFVFKLELKSRGGNKD